MLCLKSNKTLRLLRHRCSSAHPRRGPLRLKGTFHLPSAQPDGGPGPTATSEVSRAEHDNCSFVVSRSVAKFGNIGFCPPFAEAGRIEGQLPLAVEQLVGYHFHAGRIFEDHAVGALEIEEFG